MQRILDRLYLSSLSEANDPFFLKQHRIQAILYFGSGGMFGDDIKLYYRPANKDGSLGKEHLRDGVDFLRESLLAGRRVLAVGASGATIVGAYLAEMGFSSPEAMRLINQVTGLKADEGRLSEHAQDLEKRAMQTLHK
ncbi:hypothetical protein IT571_01015 [Candidatus Sumerlaeota bacterium]|nr:hypothetical protein [Candidatus Sumerlaeota bacterium]HNM47748.1 hypothetical protein [Candidatus Sumerlaeota bacterium]